MSLLSSERLVVAVHKRGIDTLHVRRGRLPSSPLVVLDQQRLDVDPNTDDKSDADQPWRPSAALLSALPKVPGQCKLHFVLSNHFVRYVLLPWSSIVGCNGDTQNLARAQFQLAFGEASASWHVIVEEPRFRSTCLAMAVDGQLLAATREAATVAGLQVSGIRPYLLTALKYWRMAMRQAAKRAPGWFAVFEPGRLTLLGRVQNGAASLHSIRLHDPEAMLPTLHQCVATDRLKSTLDGPVYVHAPGWSGDDADVAPFVRLDGVASSGDIVEGKVGSDRDFGQAMALAGVGDAFA